MNLHLDYVSQCCSSPFEIKWVEYEQPQHNAQHSRNGENFSPLPIMWTLFGQAIKILS